ncbi:MAG: LysR family substrate-binding domain-containing protein [Limisphaerales bacterium]
MEIGEWGQLVVGFVSSAVYGKFASVFGLMRTRHPEVALVLHDLTSEEQVEAIKAHQPEVGLVRPPVLTAPALTLRAIGRPPLVVALPETHPLAKHKRLKLAALAGEPFLLVPRHLSPGFYDQIIGLCARTGFTPRVVLEARTTPTIVSLPGIGTGDKGRVVWLE